MNYKNQLNFSNFNKQQKKRRCISKDLLNSKTEQEKLMTF